MIASGITDDGRQRGLILHLIGPDTQKIFETTTSVNSTQHIFYKHHKVFQGLLKNFELKLHIDKDFIPIQQPLGRILFHTRDKK